MAQYKDLRKVTKLPYITNKQIGIIRHVIRRYKKNGIRAAKQNDGQKVVNKPRTNPESISWTELKMTERTWEIFVLTANAPEEPLNQRVRKDYTWSMVFFR